MEPAAEQTEVLTADECWRLLRTTSVARLALCVEGQPEIFPVNFQVDHGTVVFRTSEGTKARAAIDEAPIAVQADGLDDSGTKAWSVVVKGTARSISTTKELLDTIDLPVHPWESGRKDRFVRVTPDGVTGRRFTVAEAPQTASRAAARDE
ncbi:pyridoxamine 5'-phosphate oxidase family protein [Arthrobacter sp. MSA 4-2]|uniref:pyridoxamine 5'-phosphate oxidase family protein n=1 Tax=Arthrobacter sp. MSA 4-2 TaxID=2794349 RepID=UPI0018E776E5|nr:pyridoxamine 5'-phosphate oxidase family protein [Arthrobacter sp. MSA 4-2]MBJ2119807.1 pyridoxamine 5'-phosphate oxidase family protein [Arthrobacter sp. MSA 4-2]